MSTSNNKLNLTWLFSWLMLGFGVYWVFGRAFLDAVK